MLSALDVRMSYTLLTVAPKSSLHLDGVKPMPGREGGHAVDAAGDLVAVVVAAGRRAVVACYRLVAVGAALMF